MKNETKMSFITDRLFDAIFASYSRKNDEFGIICSIDIGKLLKIMTVNKIGAVDYRDRKCAYFFKLRLKL